MAPRDFLTDGSLVLSDVKADCLRIVVFEQTPLAAESVTGLPKHRVRYIRCVLSLNSCTFYTFLDKGRERHALLKGKAAYLRQCGIDFMGR